MLRGEGGAAGGGAEEGPLRGDAADGDGCRAGVGEGERLAEGLARRDLSEVEQVAVTSRGSEIAGNAEGASPKAKAFDVTEAVERGAAIGGRGLGKDGSSDVAVGEGEEGDGKVAACIGAERSARRAGEDKLARQPERDGEGLRGEVFDGELAGDAVAAGGLRTEISLGGDDLEA